MFIGSLGHCRLDYQPLFGRGARAPPRSLSGRDQTRHERAAEIEPKVTENEFEPVLLLNSGAGQPQKKCEFVHIKKPVKVRL